MKFDISNVRASLASEGLAPADVPPLGVAMNLKIHGSSPRQMASGANGHLLLTQGAGKSEERLHQCLRWRRCVGARGGSSIPLPRKIRS